MTDTELDDLFKKSFAGHEMPVPEDMWARIQPPESRKRRGAFWWWTGAGIAAVLLLVSVVTWLHNTPTNDNLAVTSTPPNGHKETATDKAASAPAVQETATADAQAAQHSSKKSLPETIKNDNERVPQMATAGKQNQPFASINQKQYANKSTYHSKGKVITGFTGNETKRGSLNIAQANLPGNNKENIGQSMLANVDRPSIVELNKNDETAKDIQKKKDESVVQNQWFHNDSTATINKTTDSAATQLINELAKNEAKSLVKIKRTDTRRPVSIAFSAAGYNGDKKIYDAKSNPRTAFSNLAAYDPGIKTVLQGYSLNLSVEKPITSHLSLLTGLQYMQLQQSVSYLHQSVNQYSVINSTGFNSDTAVYTQFSFDRPVLRSTFNSLNFPLVLHYQTNGKGIRFGASAGVLFNLYSWYGGNVPDAGYNSTLNAKTTFRRNSGASFYTGISAAKHFGDWQLFLEPHALFGLQSMTKKEASFKQKLNAYGIGVGIRKSLSSSHHH